jgi:hypothetical protein
MSQFGQRRQIGESWFVPIIKTAPFTQETPQDRVIYVMMHSANLLYEAAKPADREQADSYIGKTYAEWLAIGLNA